ncbi:MAG: nucleotide-binding universal stress UspA family protein [Gammaproteobacteria bacterium]|jgi:nucleotide-binding universal stress UspA family protein
MSIRTILLPIRESDVADSLMESAIAMAIRNNAHLDLLYVKNDPEHMIPFATMGLTDSMRKMIIESAGASSNQQAQDLKQRFDQLCSKYEITQTSRKNHSGQSSADFLQLVGQRDALIGSHGRLADLIIVPQPLRVSPPPSSFEAALRESGRPVLMVPRDKTLVEAGKRIAIGWNNSKEAAQAIAAVMDNLQRAEQVYVICSQQRMGQLSNADDVCTYLACHGVKAESIILNRGNLSAGEALLDKAESLSCDRLVVGGYSRAKIRDVIMGGVTGHLLKHAQLPVILVH